ncbi:hypothetical protein [Pseudomonas sp. RC10]|uniref:hypothetical protein n=1 Tax=Pseudomonas bambusae TaxID=3139142 RepID=UPI00313A3DAC
MHWILHIGAPKTGSTAIQRFIFDNREQLKSQGILYPDVSLRGYGHHDLAFLLGGGYPEWATGQEKSLAQLRDELKAAVTGSDAHTVIISSENFFIFPNPQGLLDTMRDAGLAPDDRISVVCYIRRQDDAHLSWYNQTVKAQGNALNFAATTRRDFGLWDYAERLKPWQETFKDATFILHDYARFTREDIRIDFLQTLGLPAESFDLPNGRVNERINRDILNVQRLINRLPIRTVNKRRYHKQLIELTAAAAGKAVFDDSPFLTVAQRQALVDSYAASNRAIARSFFHRDELFAPIAPGEHTHTSAAPRGATLTKVGFVLHWLFNHRLRLSRRT